MTKQKEFTYMSNNQNNKIIKFLNGKVFYIVLCICFLGIGVAAWAGIEGMKPSNNGSSGSLTAELPGSNDTSQNAESFTSIPNDSSLETESKPSNSPSQSTSSEAEPTEPADSTVAALFME